MIHIKKFSIQEAFSFAWNIYKKNWKMILVVMIGSYIVLGILTGILEGIVGHDSPARGIIQLLNFAAQIIIGVGILKILLHLVDNKKIEIAQLYKYYRKALPYFAVSFLYGLIVAGGLILLIVPGIMWAIKYQFALFYVVDRNTGVIESFKKSAALTNTLKMDLLVFDLAMVGLNILGLMVFGVGVFVTGPVSALAQAHLYRKLSS